MNPRSSPRWSNTWWGKRTTVINITIVVAVLLFCLWKTLVP